MITASLTKPQVNDSSLVKHISYEVHDVPDHVAQQFCVNLTHSEKRSCEQNGRY